MEVKILSSEQAHWGLGAMTTVAMADGALDASARHKRSQRHSHRQFGVSSDDRGVATYE